MEPLTITKVMEEIQEAYKSTADLYAKTSLSIMDAYNKQLETSAEWHNKFVETIFRNDLIKNTEFSSDVLKKNIEAYQKMLNETIRMSKDVTEKILKVRSVEDAFSPVSEEVVDAVFGIFCKQTELISDSGKQFLNVLKENNLGDFSEQFERFQSDTFAGLEKSIKDLIDGYNKNAEFTKKSAEQLTVTITKRFDELTEANTKIFNDLLKKFEMEKKTNGKATNNKATNNKK